MKRIHIVAGIILSADHQAVYITKRPNDKHKGGLWEFPGGKVELGENISTAMARELDEEIGIQVVTQSPFEHFAFDYPDKSLTFDFIVIREFRGAPYGKEGQLGQWVPIAQLDQFAFPEANQPIVQRVMKEFPQL